MAEAKKAKKKFGFNIYMLLLMFVLIPLIIAVVTLTIVLVSNSKSQIKETTLNYLFDVTESSGQRLDEKIAVDGVDASLTAENLEAMFGKVGIEGLSSSYAYIVSADGTMMYHPTASKIGEPVSNDVVKGIVADLKNNKKVAPAVVEYLFNGAMKYAATYVGSNSEFILVISADEVEVLANCNSIMWTAIIIAAILVVFFALVAILLSRKVSKPMGVVANNVELIAEGSLSSEKEDTTASVLETKMLVRASKKLQVELSNVILKTQDVAGKLITAVEEVSALAESSSSETSGISNAMEDLAQGATSLATSVQDISEQVVEISTIIGEIAENVETLSSAAGNIQKANVDATEYINKVANSSTKSVGSVSEINSQIISTNEAIAKIDAAVNVISSVASQTNLLALNASIEAARAGEAGRGFAVVADEINSLSVQSADGAKEIASIVSEIKAQSAKSVDLAETVSNIITEEQGYISDTQNKFEILHNEIEKSLIAIRGISDKMDGLEKVRSVISSNVEDLSAISEENAASNQEVSASLTSIASSITSISGDSQSMNELAKELQEAVSYFK